MFVNIHIVPIYPAAENSVTVSLLMLILSLTGLEGHICPSLVKDRKEIYVQLL